VALVDNKLIKSMSYEIGTIIPQFRTVKLQTFPIWR
jgi:hypothetical protein